jgi:hypothetical protein
MQSYVEPTRGKEGGMKHREKITNKEMQDEGDLTNEKLNGLMRDNQMKKVRMKESLDQIAFKRARLLMLCILVGRFSLFLHGMNLRFP